MQMFFFFTFQNVISFFSLQILFVFILYLRQGLPLNVFFFKILYFVHVNCIRLRFSLEIRIGGKVVNTRSACMAKSPKIGTIVRPEHLFWSTTIVFQSSVCTGIN